MRAGPVTLGIRPEDIYETQPPELQSKAGALPVHVVAVEPLGAETLVVLRLASSDVEVIARVGRDSRLVAGRGEHDLPRPRSDPSVQSGDYRGHLWLHRPSKRERGMRGSSHAIDCHAHIIDPARFPFADGPGYRPKPGEVGTVEAYEAVLDANRVDHALLVQPSGYGVDNSAILDAMQRSPGRFRAIGRSGRNGQRPDPRGAGCRGVRRRPLQSRQL